jgi:hypothetical protein
MIDSESLWELVEHASIKFDHLCIERPEPSLHGPGSWCVVIGDPFDGEPTRYYGKTLAEAMMEMADREGMTRLEGRA